MDFLHQLFQNNLDVVFFIYGLAFIIMGISILIQPKRESKFRIANIFWLLAIFGLSHGINEILDMWAIIKGRNPSLDLIRWFILVISYFFLFEFGRQLLRLNFNKLSGLWISPVIGITILICGGMSQDFWNVGSISTRYLLGFTGGLMIGFGFFSYYKSEKLILEPLHVKKYFVVGGLSFIIYGILGGLIVPKGHFFPSNWLNTESFFSVVNFPVQVFRAVCAVVAAWAITGMLRIFNWEIRNELKETHSQLKEQLKDSEKRYLEAIELSSDMIHSIDTNGILLSSNITGYKLLGFSKDEIISSHLKEIYTPDGWDRIRESLNRLTLEGSLFIDKGLVIKKSGEVMNVVIHLTASYDNKGELFGARLTTRDISERIILENELNKRVKELEEFYDLAIGRELRMSDLKNEIFALNKEIERHGNERE